MTAHLVTVSCGWFGGACSYTPVGESVLADAFAGYHACVFAYGQTGSGKSYTMMGTPSDPLEQGITPRLCQDLFGRIESMVASNPKWYGKVEVSYMEIYLEQVRDLLNPSSTKKLKVREHSLTGPYVESLSTHAVSDFAMVKKLMDEGASLLAILLLCSVEGRLPGWYSGNRFTEDLVSPHAPHPLLVVNAPGCR